MSSEQFIKDIPNKNRTQRDQPSEAREAYLAREARSAERSEAT